MPETFGFEGALALLKSKEGVKLARTGWNGKDMYIQAQFPDEHSKMKRPYIFIVPDAEHVVPWVASHADLFTNDWFEVTD